MTRVFVLGNATVDLSLRVTDWPRPGETILASQARRGPGGKGLNQAVAALRAGADVTLCAPIGDDADGAFLRDFAVRQRGLTVRWRPCDAVTDISTIWVSDSGENMIVSSADCARSIAPSEIPGLLDGISAGDHLILQGNLAAEPTLAAALHARASGARVILNTAPIAWDMTPMLAVTDLLICNQPEAALLTGGASESDAVDRLLDAGVDQVLLTLGARGAIGGKRGQIASTAAPAVQVVDTAGAGDVTVGYLVAGLMQGMPFAQACTFAMQAAALSVTRPGTLEACPTRAEVPHGQRYDVLEE